MATPYVIGIAGTSCSGKTMVASRLADALPGRAVIVSSDAYYHDLSALGPRERASRNFDTPHALDAPLLLHHLNLLRLGSNIQQPVYDFRTHTRAGSAVTTRSGRWIIVEGLFILFWERVRSLCSTAVFVETASELCLSRRVSRDSLQRGGTASMVRRQFCQTVRPMADRYVLPTRTRATLTVSGEAPPDETALAIVEHVRKNTGEL